MCVCEGIYADVNYAAMSSMNTVSPNLKRSATAAKLDTSGTTSSSKHRRLKENKTEEATDTLVTANKDYATWKFSDGSFSISHVLNLLVESGYAVHVCGHTS